MHESDEPGSDRTRGRVRRGVALVLRTAFRRHLGLSLLVIVMALVLALMPAVQLRVLGMLVDGVGQGDRISLLPIVLLGLTLGLSTVVNSIQIPFREQLYTDVSGDLLEKELAVFVDAAPGDLSDPGVQDRLRIRRESADDRSRVLLDTLLNVGVAAVTSLGVGGVLFSVSPLVAVLMCAGAAAPLVVMHRIRTVWQRAQEDAAAPQRVHDDLFHLGAQPRAFDAILQHGGGGRVRGESMRMWRVVRGLILGAQRTEALLCVVCAVLTTAFVTAALLVLLRSQDVSVGDMAIVASSVAALATLNQLVVWASGCVEVAQFVGDLDAPLVQRAAAGPSRTGGEPTRLEGIELEGASFTYRGRTAPAIDEVSVRLAASGLVVLTGPNGAGKSTLAKLASGALHPYQGAVRWLRADGTSTPPSWQEVSVLHQDEAMLPLSVRDFVRMGTDASDQQIAAALRRTGLGPLLEAAPRLLDQRVGEGYEGGAAFSGGQFQRLCLARLLLQDRPMWVLDEPTSAIDVAGDADFLDLLRETGAERFVLVITHKELGFEDGDELWRVEHGRPRLLRPAPAGGPGPDAAP
ncbi:ABC transporter ATP-binding protein [Brachybacterium phenoliresistens]|uniref:ATP-binding cassette domain-containing protein n=1 Tax=Brachybacterium phenoliresistens TaxID=396014 RepID=UPI0018DEBB04|nr:ABC transporter ATP-binding protein [Brachybacterium phenoliresistens]